jgi:hypothetical protein
MPEEKIEGSELEQQNKDLLHKINSSNKLHKLLISVALEDISKSFIDDIQQYNKKIPFNCITEEELHDGFTDKFADQFRVGFITHFSTDSSILFISGLKLDQKVSEETKITIGQKSESYLDDIDSFEHHELFREEVVSSVNLLLSVNLAGLPNLSMRDTSRSTQEALEQAEKESLQWQKDMKKSRIYIDSKKSEILRLKYQLLKMYFVGYCTYEMLKLKNDSMKIPRPGLKRNKPAQNKRETNDRLREPR